MNPTTVQPSQPARPRSLWRRRLVLGLFMLALVLTAAGCDFYYWSWDDDENINTSSETSQQTAPEPSDLSLNIGQPEYDASEGRFNFEIRGRVQGPPYPDTVLVCWCPPVDSTDFDFETPPDDQERPLFEWFEVPVDQDTGAFEIEYIGYKGPPDPSQVNTVCVDSGGESARKAVVGYQQAWQSIRQTSGKDPGSGTVRQSQPTASDMAARAADPYYLWQVNQWFYTDEGTMTASRCQDWMNLLQSDQAFLALRFPIYPPTLAYMEAYTLPIVFREPYSPTLTLWDTRGPTVPLFTAPLELRAMRHTFLESELPPAEGERWVALGAVTTPIVDCSGVPIIPDGQWDFEANLYLDLGGTPEAGRDKVLPIYYCYEGQAPPGAEAASYQGWNSTCLGPHYLTLRDDLGDWELAGQGMDWITPTQVVSFPHTIYNWTVTPPVPLTFTLEVSSTLTAGWAFYADPQGQTSLAGPVRVDDYLDFWVIGQVPASAADGPYELFVTARTEDTLPATQQVTDLMWAGNWVAPPPAPSAHHVFLPLILK